MVTSMHYPFHISFVLRIYLNLSWIFAWWGDPKLHFWGVWIITSSAWIDSCCFPWTLLTGCVRVQWLSHVWLFVARLLCPWEEYWSGFPFLLQGMFPTQGLNLCLPHWQADSLPLSDQRRPLISILKFSSDISFPWFVRLICISFSFGTIANDILF